jgi:hypothetical protein
MHAGRLSDWRQRRLEPEADEWGRAGRAYTGNTLSRLALA